MVIKDILSKYIQDSDKVIEAEKEFSENCIYSPKVKFGETIFGVDIKSKNYFKGQVVGISYNLTANSPDFPEIWYIVATGFDKVEVLSENQIYTSEEEVRERLLKR